MQSVKRTEIEQWVKSIYRFQLDWDEKKSRLHSAILCTYHLIYLHKINISRVLAIVRVSQTQRFFLELLSPRQTHCTNYWYSCVCKHFLCYKKLIITQEVFWNFKARNQLNTNLLWRCLLCDHSIQEVIHVLCTDDNNKLFKQANKSKLASRA